ncbi:hypothetical protein [Photobacterium kagoshimensis]|uniref:hypothetical protein n=1 Tax=Photobacterium kagoshimensis TaxID=2910242 RepID=UPI003D149DFC
MAKSLCKYRRVEIADKIAIISKIVSEPNYMCSSCARVASDKVYLCKPSALVSQTRLAKVQSAASMSTTVPEMTVLTESQPEQDLGKKVTKLAKKKAKRLKQAAKAVKRYNRAVKKAQQKEEGDA